MHGRHPGGLAHASDSPSTPTPPAHPLSSIVALVTNGASQECPIKALEPTPPHIKQQPVSKLRTRRELSRKKWGWEKKRSLTMPDPEAVF